MGDKWLRARTSVLMEVPSAIIPTQTNLVINPLHPEGWRASGSSRFRRCLDRRRLGLS
ncbi:MAG: RES domain-containing protein [Deltaproteobacteria bacterium]|nr:RES domain-containing protein [Deltaproteobacteria bacterium]